MPLGHIFVSVFFFLSSIHSCFIMGFFFQFVEFKGAGWLCPPSSSTNALFLYCWKNFIIFSRITFTAIVIKFQILRLKKLEICIKIICCFSTGYNILPVSSQTNAKQERNQLSKINLGACFDHLVIFLCATILVLVVENR